MYLFFLLNVLRVYCAWLFIRICRLKGLTVHNQDGPILRRSDPDRRPSALERRDAPVHPRLQAVIQAGRHQGVELDPNEYKPTAGEAAPSAAALSLWAQDAGILSPAARLRWRRFVLFPDARPVGVV